jgi:hypothetical protein
VFVGCLVAQGAGLLRAFNHGDAVKGPPTINSGLSSLCGGSGTKQTFADLMRAIGHAGGHPPPPQGCVQRWCDEME